MGPGTSGPRPPAAVQLLAVVLLAVACLRPVLAGPVLDEILNCPHLGAHSGPLSGDRHCRIGPEAPVGQTFTVGSHVDRIWRIAIWQAFWHETWQPDEVLVMTLWDGPEKKVSYGRDEVPYPRRMWEGAVAMFTLDARVAPERSYYFELTVRSEPLRPAETPREWLLGGKRPGFADGDGILDGVGTSQEDYPDGAAYVGATAQDYDLWFEVHTKPPLDRDALYSEAFSRLDLAQEGLRPLAEAVASREWDAACRELVRHFESREDLLPHDRLPKYDPAFDTTQADLAYSHQAAIDKGYTADLGPRWNHYALWPERGGVGLTRSGLRKPLAAGYKATGNDKYARAFNDLLACFFTDCPSPLRAGAFSPEQTVDAARPCGIAGGSMWSALSIGARMGHGFWYYGYVMSSPSFTTDVRAAFIINLGEMADVLERMKGGGNWEAQMGEALFDFGLTYPEFKSAKRWVQQGFDTLVANALSTVYPDGVLHEPSIGYHMLVMNRFSSLMEKVGALGLTLPPEMTKLTEGMFEYVMASTLPDGTLPVWGDANHPLWPDLLERGARLFSRQDMLFVRSQGAEGQPPAETSRGFPDGGYYYMRTGWQPDAHYLACRCGPYGSHGHRDTLSLVAAADGRTLLIDPGVSTYGTPESRELTKTSSHSTVTVDGQDAESGEAERWASGLSCDYFAGHNRGYRDTAEVRHQRRIWFLKPTEGHPAVWAVFDDVAGTGEHDVALRYRFAPVSMQCSPLSRTAWTEGEGGNLLLHLHGPEAATLDLGEGIAVWDELLTAPVLTQQARGPLPVGFATALVPYAGERPEVKSQTLATSPASAGAHALWVELDDYACYLAVTSPGEDHSVGKRQVTLPGGTELAYSAPAIAVRLQRQGDTWAPRLVHAVDAASVTLGGQELLGGGVREGMVDVPVDREP